MRAILVFVLIACVSASLAAPVPPRDEDMPGAIQYHLAILEASALRSILSTEINIRNEERDVFRADSEKRLRLLKPLLYTNRLELIDGVLANPQRILKRDLTALERAALKAKRAEIDRAYQKAIERGEVEKNPPK